MHDSSPQDLNDKLDVINTKLTVIDAQLRRQAWQIALLVCVALIPAVLWLMSFFTSDSYKDGIILFLCGIVLVTGIVVWDFIKSRRRD